MDAQDDRPTAGQPARRPARARRTSPPPAPAPRPETIKLQLTLRPEVKHWLEVHALGDGSTISELVSRIVEAQPTRHYLSTRQARPGLTIADHQAEDRQAEAG